MTYSTNMKLTLFVVLSMNKVHPNSIIRKVVAISSGDPFASNKYSIFYMSLTIMIPPLVIISRASSAVNSHRLCTTARTSPYVIVLSKALPLIGRPVIICTNVHSNDVVVTSGIPISNDGWHGESVIKLNLWTET
jgi:hypothetical protein